MHTQGTVPFIAHVPIVGLDTLIVEASRSYSDTLNSIRLLWTRDQPDADTSPWQHTTLTTDIQAPGNPRIQAAADPRLRPRGHWDQRGQ